MQFTKSAIASDVKNFIIELDGQDITEAVSMVTIFQDVFLPSWSCVLDLHDTNNLIMNIPIKPNKPISVYVETSVDSEMDDAKKFKFVVSHISEKQHHNEKEYTYKVHGISPDLYKNQKTRVSKSYKPKPADQIASNIISEFIGGTLESDTSDYATGVIIPNFSPFIAVSHLCKTATHNGIADYLFFMQDDSKFTMRSFEKLYASEDSGFEFKMQISNIRNDSGDPAYDYCTIINNYQFIEHDDGLLTVSSGMAANKTVEFNMVNKKWKNNDYTYGNDSAFDGAMKSWDSDMESTNSTVMFVPHHQGMHDFANSTERHKDWVSSRRSNLMKLDDNKLVIQVPGGVKAWRGLGKFCKVEIPSQQDLDESQKIDKHYSGKYFIMAISHMISKAAYYVNFEMCKKRSESKFNL